MSLCQYYGRGGLRLIYMPDWVATRIRTDNRTRTLKRLPHASQNSVVEDRQPTMRNEYKPKTVHTGVHMSWRHNNVTTKYKIHAWWKTLNLFIISLLWHEWRRISSHAGLTYIYRIPDWVATQLYVHIRKDIQTRRLGMQTATLSNALQNAGVEDRQPITRN